MGAAPHPALRATFPRRVKASAVAIKFPAAPKGFPLGELARELLRGRRSEQTERVSLRTLPKKAGNISLTLREWGLFCIESRLQGAGGVCYTYGMEESNATLQQRTEADL